LITIGRTLSGSPDDLDVVVDVGALLWVILTFRSIGEVEVDGFVKIVLVGGGDSART
jgi:hypothetical protein